MSLKKWMTFTRWYRKNTEGLSENYAFLHMAKTGGTSIRSAIREADAQGFNPPDILGHETTLKSILKHHPNTRISVTLRDPLDRIESAFESRMRQSRPSYTALWKAEEAICYLWFPTLDDFLQAKLSSDERTHSAVLFAERYMGHIRRGYEYHFHSVDFVKKHKDRFYFIGDISRLSVDFCKYFEPTDVPSAFLETVPKRLHVGGAPNTRSIVLQDLRSELQGAYEAEYEIYEYLRSLSKNFL